MSQKLRRRHRAGPATPGLAPHTAVALALLLSLLPTHTMQTSDAPSDNLQSATLGGGCFWCLEAAFERYHGVESVVSGYAGGNTPNPTYQQVTGGTTGHAEVVQIKFNPAVITYDQLLEIFWEIHDPTTLNRQGADRGTQYRSIILVNNAEQRLAAEKSRQQVSARFADPIVTEIVPLNVFYPAEAEHQNFYRRNPSYPYCRIVINPKLQKLEKSIPATRATPPASNESVPPASNPLN